MAAPSPGPVARTSSHAGRVGAGDRGLCTPHFASLTNRPPAAICRRCATDRPAEPGNGRISTEGLSLQPLTSIEMATGYRACLSSVTVPARVHRTDTEQVRFESQARLLIEGARYVDVDERSPPDSLPRVPQNSITRPATHPASARWSVCVEVPQRVHTVGPAAALVAGGSQLGPHGRGRIPARRQGAGFTPLRRRMRRRCACRGCAGSRNVPEEQQTAGVLALILGRHQQATASGYGCGASRQMRLDELRRKRARQGRAAPAAPSGA